MRLLFGISLIAAAVLLAGGILSAKDTARKVIVMIDPGHGGNDSGALGPRERPPKNGGKAPARLMEKRVALSMAKLLGEQLESRGYVVRYTRTADVAVPLHERARAANEAGADVFVSLHLNAFSNINAKGSEVYFLSLGPVDKDIQKIADAENNHSDAKQGIDDWDELDALDDQDFLEGMLDDLAQQAYLLESERMAVSIQYELNTLAGIKERGVKQAPFAVLRRAAMPAVLVETAFISNPAEAAKLRDATFLKSATRAIAKGIHTYIESTGNNKNWRKTTP